MNVFPSYMHSHHLLLFQEYPLVVSTPIQFGWVGGVGIYTGTLSALQKIPYRVYVGLKEAKEGRACRQWIVYLHKKKCVEYFMPEQFFHKDVQQRYRSWCQEQYGKFYEFGVFSEYDWHDSNAVILGLVWAMEYEVNKTTPQEQNVIEKALSLVRHLSPDGTLGTSGASFFCGMKDSAYPVLFSSHPDHVCESTVMTLEEQLKIQDTSFPFPFEFALCSPSVEKIGRIYTFQRLLAEKESIVLERPYIKTDDTSRKHAIATVLDLYSNRVVESFMQSMQGKKKTQLFSYLKQFHTLNHLFCFDEISSEHQHEETLLLEKYISELAINQDEWFLQERMISGNLKVLVATVPGILQRVFSYPDMEMQLEYASWQKGIEQVGVRLEQDREKAIGKIANQELYICLRTYEHRKMIPLAEVNRYREQVDVFVDRTKDKIYVGGYGVNSDILLSQRFTATVCSLIKTPKGSFSLDLLPKSSYTLEPQDFLKKIILPFQRVISERLHKDVHMSLLQEGGKTVLYYDFSSIILGIIEKND